MSANSSAAAQRILIIGNGGSGKSWLARKLGASLGLAPVHLDELRWEPGHYGKARDNQVVVDDVIAAATADAWLMEGVYGWLAKAVIARATELIWIDLPEDECLANVRARGIQGGGSAEAFAELLKWVAEYRLRNNSSCFTAHQALYEEFAGQKARLRGRDEMADYLQERHA